MVAVPRLWPESTMVVCATGPSLTAEDVSYCRDKAHVIAVNDAHRLAPWAACLYSSDASWYHRHDGASAYDGPKWTVDYGAWRDTYGVRYPAIQRLQNTGDAGIETDPSGLRNGRNSGYAAINLAIHYGATRILLLGFDMGRGPGQPAHFFGDHPGSLQQRSPFVTFIAMFRTMVAPLKALGVEVINCTRGGRLNVFPRADVREVLA